MTQTPCPEFEARLEASLFGELDAAEQTAVDAHVTECAGCRDALEDARVAFAALSDIADPPLPYPEVEVDAERAEKAWSQFQKRVKPDPAPRIPRHRAYELLAMAAMLVIGIGLGSLARLETPDASDPVAVAELEIAPEAIEALERAELLSDVGVRYVDGLQGLLVDVMSFSVEGVSTEDVVLTRERANELLTDGRLLELALDADEDRDFLRAIRRAELFLEELAAVEASTSGTGVGVFQASLAESHLTDDLAALDLNAKVSLAIEASGWIGRDGDASRKEF